MELESLKRIYDKSFVPSKEYLESLPDLQNSEFIGTPITYVGMAGIKRPFRIRTKEGGIQEVLATIIGHTDNDANSRGINMSRINRELAVFDKKVFNINELISVLDSLKKKMGRFNAGLSVEFEYRTWQEALRSNADDGSGNKAGGWQYNNVEFELINDRRIIWVSYVYSSHCPCSTELSIHAGHYRGVAASPHAQRSVAKIGIEMNTIRPEWSSRPEGNISSVYYQQDQPIVWIEDILDACRRAVPSQVQIFVKRADEQAFAELCAAKGTVFVEDAIRLFESEISELPGVKDYKIMCLHAESLHPWGAHAMVTKGLKDSIFSNTFTMSDMRDLERFV